MPHLCVRESGALFKPGTNVGEERRRRAGTGRRPVHRRDTSRRRATRSTRPSRPCVLHLRGTSSTCRATLVAADAVELHPGAARAARAWNVPSRSVCACTQMNADGGTPAPRADRARPSPRRPSPVCEAMGRPVARCARAAARTSFASIVRQRRLIDADLHERRLDAGAVDAALGLANPARGELLRGLGEGVRRQVLVVRRAVVAGVRQDVDARRLDSRLQQPRIAARDRPACTRRSSRSRARSPAADTAAPPRTRHRRRSAIGSPSTAPMKSTSTCSCISVTPSVGRDRAASRSRSRVGPRPPLARRSRPRPRRRRPSPARARPSAMPAATLVVVIARLAFLALLGATPRSTGGTGPSSTAAGSRRRRLRCGPRSRRRGCRGCRSTSTSAARRRAARSAPGGA